MGLGVQYSTSTVQYGNSKVCLLLSLFLTEIYIFTVTHPFAGFVFAAKTDGPTSPIETDNFASFF